VLNLISFILYGADKAKAKKGSWRIKESTLLIASLLGAFGAWIGMNVFRHKTQKAKFMLVYVFLVLHVVGISILFWYFTGNI
jgi:uncharacterized membrane protein YsdA (DUF1294 family)